MLITQQGKILRMASNDIRTIGRATQGVRLIDIEGDDRAVSIARLAEKDEERLDEKKTRTNGIVPRALVLSVGSALWALVVNRLQCALPKSRRSSGSSSPRPRSIEP